MRSPASRGSGTLLSGKVMFGAAGGPGFGIGGYGGNSNGANDSLATGMDIAISPKLLTDFRLGYYRYNVIDSKYDRVSSLRTTLGIPGINTGSYFTSGAPGFEIGNRRRQTSYIGGGLDINRCNCPLTEREDQFQIVNNWTMVHGNHTIKVGVDLRYGRNLRVPSDTDRAGQMNFNPGPTSQRRQYLRERLGNFRTGRRSTKLWPVRFNVNQRQGIPEDEPSSTGRTPGASPRT